MFRRSGFQVRRRWLSAGLLGFGMVAAYVLFSMRARPAVLELVARGGDGQFRGEVAVDARAVDAGGATAGAVVRVPLTLGVRNNRGEAIRPTRLVLSLPTRYRLTRPDGNPLMGVLTPGVPLVRYALDLPIPELAPERRVVPIAADTLWLETILPAFQCVVLADQVPEFVPSPPVAAEALSRVQIFYSFEGEGLDRRHTGLLRVQLDPAVLRLEAPERPPVYATEYRSPGHAMPPFLALKYMGNRQAFCGEADDPIEILSTLWETPEGGRFLVLDHGGAPRKYLFDLDRDSIVEMEMWDATGDGHFEARRPARLPLPAFLMPPPPAPGYDPSHFEEMPDSVLIALDRFAVVRRGRYEYRAIQPDTAVRVRRYRPQTLGDAEDDAPSGYTQRFAPLTGPAAGETPAPAGRPGLLRLRRPQQRPAAPPLSAPPVTPRPPAAGQQRTPRQVPAERAPVPSPFRAPSATPEPAPTPSPFRRPAPEVQPPRQPAEPPRPAPREEPEVRPPAAEPAGGSPRREPRLLGRPIDSIPPGGR